MVKPSPPKNSSSHPAAELSEPKIAPGERLPPKGLLPPLVGSCGEHGPLGAARRDTGCPNFFGGTDLSVSFLCFFFF